MEIPLSTQRPAAIIISFLTRKINFALFIIRARNGVSVFVSQSSANVNPSGRTASAATAVWTSLIFSLLPHLPLLVFFPPLLLVPPEHLTLSLSLSLSVSALLLSTPPTPSQPLLRPGTHRRFAGFFASLHRPAALSLHFFIYLFILGRTNQDVSDQISPHHHGEHRG